MFNNDRKIILRITIEEYGSDIEYIKGGKNIVTYSLSIFPLNGDQETTR